MRVVAIQRPTKARSSSTASAQGGGSTRYGYVFQARRSCLAQRRATSAALEIMGWRRRGGRAAKYLAMVGLAGFDGVSVELSAHAAARLDRRACRSTRLLLMGDRYGALDEISASHLNEQLLRLWSGRADRNLRDALDLRAVFLSNRT